MVSLYPVGARSHGRLLGGDCHVCKEAFVKTKATAVHLVQTILLGSHLTQNEVKEIFRRGPVLSQGKKKMTKYNEEVRTEKR